MKRDKTNITILLDESGSMYGLTEDVIGSTNKFIEEQQKEPGKCKITIIGFDAFRPRHVIRDRVDVAECKPLDGNDYEPGGSTPLLDAMGSAIQATKDSDKWQQIFVVYTDGLENASREWTNEKLAKLVKQKTKKSEWVFTYLGANQDAFAVAHSIGVSQGNTQSYNADSYGTYTAAASTSSLTSSVRQARAGGQSVNVEDVYASVGVEKEAEKDAKSRS